MTSAFLVAKITLFLIETELRPNRDQLVFARKNVVREMTTAPETDKDQQTPCTKIDLQSFTSGVTTR